jgi:two-component system, NtrC family, C4-dicarboxylate transport sensor histidine kinase DctB
MMDDASRQVVALLRRGIDFALIGNARFDAETGRLELRATEAGLPRSLMVAHDHWNDLSDAIARDEARVEFHAVEGENEDESGRFRLVLQGGRGVLIRLEHEDKPTTDSTLVSAMAVHELKQPLFTIGMAAKSIELMLDRYRVERDDGDLDGIAQAVARIRLQIERSHAIMAGVIGYVNPTLPGRQSADVCQAVLRAQDFLKPLLDQHEIAVTLALPDEALPVPVSRVALEQVIVNAIHNAVDSLVAARANGKPAGALTLFAAREQDSVQCRISDDGEGLARGEQDAVFRPFFTTKSAQGSLGLGLHISRQIITGAGGTIDLMANADAGATLAFVLPVYLDI